jgi:hypothetical protein
MKQQALAKKYFTFNENRKIWHFLQNRLLWWPGKTLFSTLGYAKTTFGLLSIPPG